MVGAQHLVRGGGQVVLAQDACADGVVDVVVHVGDAVGDGHHAALQRLGAHRPGVVQNAVAHLRREVEAPPAVLDALHYAQALLVVAVQKPAAPLAVARAHRRRAAVARQAARQRLLAGVPEGGVPQVVAQRDGLGQILVEPQRAGDGARDLGHFQRVGEPRAVVVALGGQEHLRLVGQAAERLGMEDLVAVALEVVAQDVGGGRAVAPLAFRRARGVLGQKLPFALLLVLAMDDAHGRLPSSGAVWG